MLVAQSVLDYVSLLGDDSRDVSHAEVEGHVAQKHVVLEEEAFCFAEVGVWIKRQKRYHRYSQKYGP